MSNGKKMSFHIHTFHIFEADLSQKDISLYFEQIIIHTKKVTQNKTNIIGNERKNRSLSCQIVLFK